MNRADRMLAVLLDGEPHSRAELHAAGGYYLTNNAATELRDRGYNVVQRTRREHGETVYTYRLDGLPEAQTSGPCASGSAAGATGDLPPSANSPAPTLRCESERQPPSLDDEQLTLLEAA